MEIDEQKENIYVFGCNNQSFEMHLKDIRQWKRE